MTPYPRLRRAADVVLALFGFLLLAFSLAARAGNPDALWNIVHGQCVPDQQAHANPAPCTLVDLSAGVARGYVVLKDRAGATQFLVLPTARISGIESPALRAVGVADYLQDAWAARRFVRARAPGPLGRSDLSLAVNSVYGRTQSQLHIHVDCLKPEVRRALSEGRSALSDDWQRFPASLAGQSYIARRLLGPDLGGINVFRLLAESSPDARAHMGAFTLVIAGAFFDGRPGFVLLADRADPAHGNRGSGESLQDHTCALARPGS
ncbi:MAG: CDP-diacylglycerol diphosphatase [Acetobacteraceae bacterium]